jgi:hypothetical protein
MSCITVVALMQHRHRLLDLVQCWIVFMAYFVDRTGTVCNAVGLGAESRSCLSFRILSV